MKKLMILNFGLYLAATIIHIISKNYHAAIGFGSACLMVAAYLNEAKN